ncbi:hypothetical protein clem_00885 [Legionella clemsonensis]|uniref:Uncharacterized protein n=2 Tax=Legionella clemsonensis TaxID=1867846 RepID=A0A222NYS4_9GAMM|nr:hypothetical protein clem_00885 [Legionella clemsonensis]
MPFFSMQTPEQIKNYCHTQSFEELRELNHRYGPFLEKISAQEDLNKQEIAIIHQQIEALQKQIESEKEQEDQRRKNIRNNLPGNSAERYLALQTLAYPTLCTSSLEQKVEALRQQEIKLQNHNAWIRSEIRGCTQELKIINAVMREKERAETEALTVPHSCK